jgi:hypothetical protein
VTPRSPTLPGTPPPSPHTIHTSLPLAVGGSKHRPALPDSDLLFTRFYSKRHSQLLQRVCVRACMCVGVYVCVLTHQHECVSKSFRTESLTKYTLYNNKLSLRSNTKGYGGKTHYTDSQNSDITAPSVRELYHLQFSLKAASPETFGYTLMLAYACVYVCACLYTHEGIGGWVGLRAGLDAVVKRKIPSPLRESNPTIIQPAAQRCTTEAGETFRL